MFCPALSRATLGQLLRPWVLPTNSDPAAPDDSGLQRAMIEFASSAEVSTALMLHEAGTHVGLLSSQTPTNQRSQFSAVL